MKRLKYLAFAIIAGLAVSCSNETLTDDIQISSEDIQTKTIADNPVNIQTVAELMSCIELNEAIVNEVKAGIDRSFKYGLGYNFRFNDILKPEESKLIRTLKINQSLANELRNVYAKLQSVQKKSLSGDDFFTFLANSNLIIRWPYADNWNGVDEPIIGIASEDGNSLYKPKQNIDGTFTFDTLYVNKKFIQDNPIWVITESSYSNDELPDFENGEFVNKNGTYFYSQYAAEKMNKEAVPASYKGLYITEMEFYKHYEGLNGAGEFEFYWLSVPNGVGKCANIMNFNSDGQLKKVLQVNKLIRSDWPKVEVDNGLVILEKDGGKDKKDSRILRYDEITNNTYFRKNVTVEYSYEKRDERIMNSVWERSMICSDLNYAPNGDLRKNYGLDNDFWITFKYFE